RVLHKESSQSQTSYEAAATLTLHLKSKDEAPTVIITFLKRITVLLQSLVIIIRTDNDTEFKNQVLKVYFDSVGISHQMSSVRTPQQNRVVERRNRTLVEAARTMLIFSRAPLFLWAEVIATACFTQNRSIIHRRFNKTPYELINVRKLDISFLHVFGALCYPKNDRKDIGKLGAKGDIGFFIGYSADSYAYKIYNRRTKKIMETMNVSFDELSAMAFEQHTTVENVPPAQEPQVHQTSTASTTIANNITKDEGNDGVENFFGLSTEDDAPVVIVTRALKGIELFPNTVGCKSWTDPIIKVEKTHKTDVHRGDWNPIDKNYILPGFDHRNLTSDGVASPVHKFVEPKALLFVFGGVPTSPLSLGSAGVAFAAETGLDEDDTLLDGLEVSKLGISQEIVNALAKKGITKLFPIQFTRFEPTAFGKIGVATITNRECGLPILGEIIKHHSSEAKVNQQLLRRLFFALLDPAMQGRDMIGRARTGTFPGKTIAFGICYG
nr:retrovirus-related Pol polyprotein from transposon TNT 1-94 [Tanacetum cinerariifolium]